MQVVIMGCGRVGAQLAGLLSMDAHKVSIIDQPKSFNRLGKNFKGEKILGFGYDQGSS